MPVTSLVATGYDVAFDVTVLSFLVYFKSHPTHPYCLLLYLAIAIRVIKGMVCAENW